MVEVEGIRYKTAARYEVGAVERTDPATARWMREKGLVAQLILQRPYSKRKSLRVYLYPDGGTWPLMEVCGG
jgi:hypothetical protein